MQTSWGLNLGQSIHLGIVKYQAGSQCIVTVPGKPGPITSTKPIADICPSNMTRRWRPRGDSSGLRIRCLPLWPTWILYPDGYFEAALNGELSDNVRSALRRAGIRIFGWPVAWPEWGKKGGTPASQIFDGRVCLDQCPTAAENRGDENPGEDRDPTNGGERLLSPRLEQILLANGPAQVLVLGIPVRTALVSSGSWGAIIAIRARSPTAMWAIAESVPG